MRKPASSKATVWTEFTKMRIKHPRLEKVYQAFDDLRAYGASVPYEPKGYVKLLAPTHSGKSTSVRSYIETVVVDDAIARGLFNRDADRALIAQKQRLVLHVTLSPNATPKSLATDILTRLEDPQAHRGTQTVLETRLYRMLQETGVELIILDELQHMSTSTLRPGPDGTMIKQNKADPTAVANTLKTMLIRGLVPMAFVGTLDAAKFLSFDGQVSGRSLEDLDFSPIRWEVPDDRKFFQQWCGKVGIKVAEHGLLPKRPNLVAGDIPVNLWAASGGKIGFVSRIVQDAVIHAKERGSETLDRSDLEWAVDHCAIPNGLCKTNPFLGSPASSGEAA